MVLGKRPVPGRPTNWIIVGQGPIALAVGANNPSNSLQFVLLTIQVLNFHIALTLVR